MVHSQINHFRQKESDPHRIRTVRCGLSARAARPRPSRPPGRARARSSLYVYLLTTAPYPRDFELELSDAGSRFRVGDMKGRIRESTGKSTFKMVTVSLIWSVRMVHSVAASGHAALRDRPWHERGELARGAALSAYRSQHKTGGEVARMEVLVDGVLVHCRWTRHLMNAKVERRQDEWRRDVSESSRYLVRRTYGG